MRRPFSRRLACDTRGNIALTFAVMAPALALGAFGVMDVAMVAGAKNRIGSVADAAALTAALRADRPVSVSDLTPLVHTIVAAHFDRATGVTSSVALNGAEPPYEVTVTVTTHVKRLLPLPGAPETQPVSVAASARVAQVGPICILALGSSGAHGVKVGSRSQILAPECGVHANNESDDASLIVEDLASLEAEVITLAGGFDGDNVAPAPRTPEPFLLDPFADKSDWPAVGACDHTRLMINTGSHTLYPGVYCGLSITGSADVALQPGIYIIKDNEFRIGSSAQVRGHEVAFFFSGDRASFRFKDAAELDFSAPSSGPLADMLMSRAPSDPPRHPSQQLGGRGPSKLDGIIYQPGVRIRANAILDSTHRPERLLLVADTIEFYGRSEMRLAAHGEAGFISTAARITR